MKTHIKVKGKAVCGQKKHKRPLKFVAVEGEEPSCGRCLRTIAK